MAGVTVEFTSDGCALLTMRNGQNKINISTLTQINQALDKVEQNENCRILITTGEGKYYSTGLDLVSLNTEGKMVETSALVLETVWRIVHFPIPTVAAINGHAFAAGAFLAIAHDYRVMNSKRGWISWNETLLNLPIRKQMANLLQLKLSSKAMREAVVFARRITALEARDLEIIDVTAEIENLIIEAKQMGFAALGKNVINRNSLQVIKKGMLPREDLEIHDKPITSKM